MSADLFGLARSAMRKAHAPYSRFPVGAALRTTDGRIFSGCNVEVVSFPEGWCAETSAIAHMVMDGGGRIDEIAIVAERLRACTPCGGCRQRIAEFGAPDTRVYLCDPVEGVVETLLLEDLFPRGFSADAL
ncbi:cytidine deaminase [Aureimonas sp. OT7]|uniref:Cytidine deaminase n=1 Tax=Aureimonas altamirensis TaxID=370622 RepID=A0A0B1Q6S3_9HYPH|nr:MULTISPECIES: cytidine deaminase [Aureimonas]KHJ54607.1 cytidine deaminase [Aureimonas altamirensis]QOG06347.1 cytidine deaminase [Aureimonas sp. OT7]